MGTAGAGTGLWRAAAEDTAAGADMQPTTAILQAEVRSDQVGRALRVLAEAERFPAKRIQIMRRLNVQSHSMLLLLTVVARVMRAVAANMLVVEHIPPAANTSNSIDTRQRDACTTGDGAYQLRRCVL